MPRPGTSAPPLDVPLLGGDRFRLADARPELFTMVVFFRGHFCGVCRRYLPELQANEEAIAEHGVEIVLVSSDGEEGSQKIADDWGVTIPIGYDLPLETAQAWDLFLTEGDPARPEMPAVFNEPGMFLVKPGGQIFFAAVNSAPAGRPGIAEIAGWLDRMASNDAYPQRGGYAPS